MLDKVSVIMTCFNHEKYIEEAILSVIHQSYDNWELLIWDDSPGKCTWEIIERFQKQYPTKIKARHHKENKGIIRNMKFLINHSNAQYIAVLEWDDYWNNEYLREKMNLFSDNKVKLVYNDLDIVDWCSKVLRTNFLKKRWINKFYKWETFEMEEVFKSFNIPYFSWSTIMFRKSLLSDISIEVPGLSPYNIISDYNFFMMVWVKYGVFGLEEGLTYYRVHNSNLSWNEGVFTLIPELCRLFSYYKTVGFISNEQRKYVTTRYLLVLMYETLKKLIKTSVKYSAINFWKYAFLKLKNLF